jgi:hypothetical protein
MRTYARAVLLLSACTCAAPAAAQAIHPVLDAKSGYVLGAPVNGTWRDGQHIARQVRAGRRYRVFGPAGPLGTATGTRAVSQDVPCAETFGVELSPRPEEGDAEVAVDGAWNVLPRPVTRLSAAAAAGYTGAVREILVQHGIRSPEVHVTGALRVDLDGDGTQEVVVSAYRSTGNGSFTVGAGDYSLVFVRKLVGSVVRTIMLEQETHPRAAGETTTNEYTIAGAWDLDGDARYEVVVRASYYEGGWTTLYRIRGTVAQKLVSAGCGA